ncbi:MAG: hypothetical protein AB1486_02755 [Planctomycetota bacterium]
MSSSILCRTSQAPSQRARPGASRAPLLAALLVLEGCLYIGGSASLGPRLDPERLALLREGTSSKQDVLRLLGPPEEFKRPAHTTTPRDTGKGPPDALATGNEAADVFTYQFDSMDIDGTWLLVFFYADVDVRSDTLVIFFDENEIVREVSFRQDTRDQ